MEHFSLFEAHLEPKPLQLPKILIGGGGPRVTMRIAAEEADITNQVGHPDNFISAQSALKQHCADIGRDYSEIERTKTENVTLAVTSEKAEEKWRSFGSPGRGNWKTCVGTPADAITLIQYYEEIGVDTLVVNFHGNDRESLKMFTEEVMPAFSN